MGGLDQIPHFEDAFTRGNPLRLPSGHVKRDGLVSKLLQDRNVLRSISAPRGFGKTRLALEYAARLFPGEPVAWIDGESPDFLLALDGGGKEEALLGDGKPRLVIIDGLPWLHEQRSQGLSRFVDAILYAGSEVIITMLPSRDCLTMHQPDCLCIYAGDLLVSEGECTQLQSTCANDGDYALSAKRWRHTSKQLFGHVPSVMWGADASAQSRCLEHVFGEGLPLSVLRGMFAMLLLGQGDFEDLTRIDAALRPDDVAMLVRDYPIFEIDSVTGKFEAAEFQFEDLRHAITANKLETLVLQGPLPLPERALGLLFNRGDSVRGSKIIDTFCNDERCAEWLVERGWDFLDGGKLSLVSNLLERCPERMYAQSRELQAMHAWYMGLSGDAREACHLADNLLRSSDDDERPDAAAIASRIALAMFDENAILAGNAPSLSSSLSPTSPLDFLAGVLDVCANVEIIRAFRMEGTGEDVRHEKARRAPSRQRTKNLKALFTENADRFKGGRAFNLALHVLSHVDSASLRRLVQELGCDAIVEMRRSGVTSFSSAALVRDMWRSGYFGLTGPVVDRRDAKMLDGAAHMLNKLAHCCGCESAQVPWEARGPVTVRGERVSKPEFTTSGAEGMYVRLFGGFEVTIGDHYIGEGKWRKKTRAMLAMLVLNQGRDVSREEMFSQIWPNASHVHALDNFYTVWSNCSALIGDSSYIERNGEYCRIDPRIVHSDVAEFERLTRHLLTSERDSRYLLDTYAKIEALYQGSLMPSETGVKLINAQRERYKAIYVDSMVAATECALHLNDVRIALWFARRALEEDSEREDVYRVLMKAHMAAGQRCLAIKTYFECRDHLRDSLGLDPSYETQELYTTLVTTDPELLRLDPLSIAGGKAGGR